MAEQGADASFVCAVPEGGGASCVPGGGPIWVACLHGGPGSSLIGLWQNSARQFVYLSYKPGHHATGAHRGISLSCDMSPLICGKRSTVQIDPFFDEDSSTFSYILLDEKSGQCAIIDSVLGYDPRSGRLSRDGAQRIAARVRERNVSVQWILETHVHADHLSAAPYLQSQLGGRTGIGSHIRTVQQVFGDLFNAEPEFSRDGRQFDHLFHDGETFTLGTLQVRAMHTPGHTPACMTYVVRDTAAPDAPAVAFVGDTLFMPDHGTARCDFPGGDARTLFRSIGRVLSLPPDTVLYMCHDYRPGGRALQWKTTVAEERAHNIHVHDGISEDDFAATRAQRDASLAMPVLLLPAVQINMRAGELPPAESNGVRYLKIPIDAF